MVSERMIKLIGEHLRIARESQGRSLDNIAIATKINIQFLEQIESGSIPNLPITYLNAFVRDYAIELGLNLDELIERITESERGEQNVSEGQKEESSVKDDQIPATPIDDHLTKKFLFMESHQIRLLILVVVAVLLGLFVMLAIIGNGKKSEPPAEISFADVIKEKDTTGLPPMKDKTSATPVDSLVLEGFVKDTVWIKVIIDGKDIREAIFPPGSRKKWIAADSLQVSVGNAMNIEFMLNGKTLGTLGTQKRPLKNVSITKATLGGLDKEGRIK